MTSLEICEKELTRTSMHISYLRNRPLLKIIVNVKFSGRKPKRKNLRYEENLVIFIIRVQIFILGRIKINFLRKIGTFYLFSHFVYKPQFWAQTN